MQSNDHNGKIAGRSHKDMRALGLAGIVCQKKELFRRPKMALGRYSASLPDYNTPTLRADTTGMQDKRAIDLSTIGFFSGARFAQYGTRLSMFQ